MSECFAQGLPRLVAVASQFLGWGPDQFWQSTPGELQAATQAPDAVSSNPVSRKDIENLMELEKNERNN